MSDRDAFQDGYDAYWEGVALEDNPYDADKNPGEFDAWIRGWREGRQHDYDESEGRG